MRYLETAGLFLTYEDGAIFGNAAEPVRVLAGGLELRPLFLGRWLTGRELGNARLDLALDSLGLELGGFFAQPQAGSFGAAPRSRRPASASSCRSSRGRADLGFPGSDSAASAGATRRSRGPSRATRRTARSFYRSRSRGTRSWALTSSTRATGRRDERALRARRCGERSLEHIDLAERVRAALPPAPMRSARSTVIAIGKASPAMVDGALGRVGRDFVRVALVVVPDGAPPLPGHPRLRVLRAAHPLPDERSVAAGEAALALARGGEGSEVHVLVSGGASSLACVPIAGHHARRRSASCRARSSPRARTFAEVNIVRRHLSRLHGGGLARARRGRRERSRSIDERRHRRRAARRRLGPDDHRSHDRRRRAAVLARYAPAFRELPLAETLKPGDPAAAAPASLVRDRARAAHPRRPARARDPRQSRLFAARPRPVQRGRSPTSRPSTRGSRRTLARARRHRPRRGARGPDRRRPPGAGRGGRTSHLAALVARDLPRGVAFMAAASDGVDGSSGTGGALVTRARFSAAGEPELDAAIARLRHRRAPPRARHRALGGPDRSQPRRRPRPRARRSAVAPRLPP